jgi:outer membrane protein
MKKGVEEHVKKIIVKTGLGLLAGFLILGTAAVNAQQLKLGYVDSQKILMSYPEALEAQKKLETFGTGVNNELKKMEDDFKALQEQLNQQSLLLSEEKKRAKAQELQDMAMQYQTLGQQRQEEIVKKREELFKPVYEKVNAAIKRMGDAEGYDMIFDAIQGNLLFAKEQYDLTEKLLGELGKGPSTIAAPAKSK